MSSHYTACGVRPMPAGSPLVVRFTNYCGLWGGAGGRFTSTVGYKKQFRM